ncbi:cytochrome P450 [Streptomyces sp. XD-27]|uniref:cytochrome P450 n=1 Tax=Streptomyces sp. XD-27 TaxID=3062779 RepID=UPI0026F4701C|nr:cytochrome P450 [Streptomyces sp. XD-27]WKX74482.1 cytochrome P450 [Streptomyces sp. XD-27]
MPPPGCPAHTGGTGHAAREPLYGPEFAADPHAVYARLRQYGPTAPVELAPGVHATLVTSYQAALEVLRSPEKFAKDARRWKALADGRVAPDNPVVPMMHYRPNCLFNDGETHARLRQPVTDSLDRVDPSALRGYVERSADTLIDRFAPNGEADLLGDYAKVLPLQVFQQLFGCPPALGERLVKGMSGIFDGIDAERANALLTETCVELISLKRRQPGADITSWMLAHPVRLTDEEMIHQLIVLMGAGTEPQQNLITNALRLLLSDDRFAGDLSGGSLPVEDALDEVLWLDPPMANYAIHYPVHDLDFGGVRLLEGEPVVISLAAANNDPALASDHRAGNRAHLAWSAGPHTCPGKDAARLIAAVAVEKLLDRIPDIELAVPADQLVWRPGPFARALAALPVRFPPVPLTVTTPLPTQAPAPEAVPARDHIDPTPGDSRWNASPASQAPSVSQLPSPRQAPSSSIPQGATSTPREPGSAPRGRRRPWSSLAAWWRGR